MVRKIVILAVILLTTGLALAGPPRLYVAEDLRTYIAASTALDGLVVMKCCGEDLARFASYANLTPVRVNLSYVLSASNADAVMFVDEGVLDRVPGALAYAKLHGILAVPVRDRMEVRRIVRTHGFTRVLLIGLNASGERADPGALLNAYNREVGGKGAVLCFRDDPLCPLAALYAAAKGARLVVLNSTGVLPHLPGTPLTLVLSFETLRSLGPEALAVAFEGGVMVSPLGIITGPDTASTTLIMARSLYFLRRPPRCHVNALVAYVEGASVAASKIVDSLRRAGLRVVELTPLGSNLTRYTLPRYLPRSGIIYLNLHGNPWAMGTRPEGSPLIAYSDVPPLREGSVVVTLSCSTLDFSRLASGSESLALRMLVRGAVAYIGSRRIEYEDLFGSSNYPELLVDLILDGYTVGEAVSVVNSLHAVRRGSGGRSWRAAYTLLLGDPDLRFCGRRARAYDVRVSGDSVTVKLAEDRSTLLLRVPAGGYSYARAASGDLRVESFVKREGDRDYMYIYITGALGHELYKGRVIEIRLVSRGPGVWLVAAALAAVLVVLLAVMAIYRGVSWPRRPGRRLSCTRRSSC